MKAIHVLLFALAFSLAFFGCTATSKTEPSGEKTQSSPPKQDYVVDLGPDFDKSASKGASPNESSIQIAVPKKNYSCSLSLDKDSIFVGESVGATVSANPAYAERATFSCGKDIKYLGTNGLFKNFYLCQYGTAEDVLLWVRINDGICASKTLHVLSPIEKMPARICSVDNASIIANSADGHFEAKVAYANYSIKDRLTWDCGGRIFYKELGASAFGSTRAEGTITVACDYVGATAKASIPKSIPIKINDEICGEIRTS